MRKWLPLLAICLGTFMLLIDVTIVNVALPDLARDLHADLGDLQWVIDIYALALAALVLGAGSLGDAIGRSRVYLGGLTLFALASLACGLSTTVGELIAARAVQGVGGAAVLATTVALLNVSYSGRDRGTAYGIWGAVSGAAAGAGVVVGGVLTELLSWHWVFLVNLPLSVVTVALSLRAFGTAAGTTRAWRLDLAGLSSFTAAAGLATYAIIRAGEDGAGSRPALGAFVAAVVALVVFVAVERRSAEPMLDLALLRAPAFTGAALAAAVLSFAAFGSLALVSIWLQQVLRLSPLHAGLALLPLSATAFVVAGATGRALHGVRPVYPIAAGLALLAVGNALAMLVGPGSSWPALVPGLAVLGVGVGTATPPLTATALGAVPLSRSGMAAGVVNTARQLGLALGVAVLGSVFRSSPAGAFADGLDRAFLVAALAGAAGSALAVVLLRARTAPATRATPATGVTR